MVHMLDDAIHILLLFHCNIGIVSCHNYRREHFQYYLTLEPSDFQDPSGPSLVLHCKAESFAVWEFHTTHRYIPY